MRRVVVSLTAANVFDNFKARFLRILQWPKRSETDAGEENEGFLETQPHSPVGSDVLDWKSNLSRGLS